MLEPFTLDDATGMPVGVDEILESGPAVIVFYRGGWSPCATLPCAHTSRNYSPSSMQNQIGRSQPAVT